MQFDSDSHKVALISVGFTVSIGNPDVLGNGLKKEEEEERGLFAHNLLMSAWKSEQREGISGSGLHWPNIGKNGGEKNSFFFSFCPQN